MSDPEEGRSRTDERVAHERRAENLEQRLDFQPVRPMASAGSLAVKAVVVTAALLVAGVLTLLGLRGDADAVGPWTLWGAFVFELVLTYALFAMLFSETVPSRKLRPSVWAAVPPLIFAVQLGVAYLTYLNSPLTPALDRATSVGVTCMGRMALMGLIPLGLGFWLLSRGLPLRPRLSGLLVGLVSGLLADSVYRLHCPYSAHQHILNWHSVAVLLLGILGFGAGVLWDLMAIRRWRARRSGREPSS